MPAVYTFPNDVVLTTVTQVLLDKNTLDDPIFKYVFPIRNVNASKLRWRIKDNMKGLMGLRGMGGLPTRINRVGDKVYEADAGVYGEFDTIDEKELTDRGANIPPEIIVNVSVEDLVMEIKMYLENRRMKRMRQICWALALNNTFSVPLGGGGVGHTDTYTGNQVTVSPLWSSKTTATPLDNYRVLQPTFGFGTSNMFNGMAMQMMNSATLNLLLGNSNPGDLGGKRVNNSTVNARTEVNQILLDGDLPPITIYDDGYYDDNGAFQLYIPTGKVLIIAKRPDDELPGEFQVTRNANNPNKEPGPYSVVQDFSTGPMQTIPPTINVHDGFNGGPVMERPSQLVTLTVA